MAALRRLQALHGHLLRSLSALHAAGRAGLPCDLWPRLALARWAFATGMAKSPSDAPSPITIPLTRHDSGHRATGPRLPPLDGKQPAPVEPGTARLAPAGHRTATRPGAPLQALPRHAPLHGNRLLRRRRPRPRAKVREHEGDLCTSFPATDRLPSPSSRLTAASGPCTHHSPARHHSLRMIASSGHDSAASSQQPASSQRLASRT